MKRCRKDLDLHEKQNPVVLEKRKIGKVGTQTSTNLEPKNKDPTSNKSVERNALGMPKI
jgi:hypothetical protein